MTAQTRALLGVHLHEIKRPEQMLRAPPPRPELVPINRLPKDLDDPQARSKALAEEPCLLQLRPYAMRCPVLDGPGNVCKVWQLLVELIKSMDLSLYTMVMLV